MEVLSSEYARAVKIERETKEREKRLERRDRRERNEGPENAVLSRYLFSRLHSTRMFSTVPAPFQLFCCRTLA